MISAGARVVCFAVANPVRDIFLDAYDSNYSEARSQRHGTSLILETCDFKVITWMMEMRIVQISLLLSYS